MSIDTVNALTDLAAVKVWCSVESDDDTFDDILESLIDSVSIQFNKLTNRDLKARAITAQYTGDGTDDILLPQYPVNTITSIFVDSEKSFGAETEVSDYDFETDSGLVILDESSFSKVFKANKFVYNGGFSTIPSDMVVAAKDQIKWLFRRWRDNTEGLTGISMEGGNIQMTEAGEILKTAFVVIKRYIRLDHGRI